MQWKWRLSHKQCCHCLWLYVQKAVYEQYCFATHSVTVKVKLQDQRRLNVQSHNTVPLSAGLNFQFVAPLPSDVISGAFYQDKLPSVTSLTGVCADVAYV